MAEGQRQIIRNVSGEKVRNVLLLDLLLLGRRKRVENEIFLAAPKQEKYYTATRSSEKWPEMKPTDFDTVDTQSPKRRRLGPHETPTKAAPVLLDSTLSAPTLSTRGCNPATLYQMLNLIEEGSYGLVYRAQHLPSSDIVAMKKIKFEKNSPGFPVTALREITSLLTLDHPNIVRYREVVVGKTHREYVCKFWFFFFCDCWRQTPCLRDSIYADKCLVFIWLWILLSMT